MLRGRHPSLARPGRMRRQAERPATLMCPFNSRRSREAGAVASARSSGCRFATVTMSDARRSMPEWIVAIPFGLATTNKLPRPSSPSVLKSRVGLFRRFTWAAFGAFGLGHVSTIRWPATSKPVCPVVRVFRTANSARAPHGQGMTTCTIENIKACAEPIDRVDVGGDR
jgi:hypothetical protein